MNPDRICLVSGNWKMHENHYEALKLLQELAGLFLARGVPKGRQISVHPPFTSLRTVQTAVETDRLPIALGAQTCHFEDRGAFTGEVSAEMLAKLGVSFVLAGHSERREWCGETDEIVRLKVDAIFRHNMRPIVCVGETGEERDAGTARQVVERQLRAGFSDLPGEKIATCVVAYEPRWAIGTGVIASADDAEEMCGTIRSILAEIAGPFAQQTLIQYGGSVNPENAKEILLCPNIDGVLVGGASLDANKFMGIIEAGT